MSCNVISLFCDVIPASPDVMTSVSDVMRSLSGVPGSRSRLSVERLEPCDTLSAFCAERSGVVGDCDGDVAWSSLSSSLLSSRQSTCSYGLALYSNLVIFLYQLYFNQITVNVDIFACENAHIFDKIANFLWIRSLFMVRKKSFSCSTYFMQYIFSGF